MLVKVNTAAVNGLDAIHITVEVNTSRGQSYGLVGLPDNAIKEGHERIVAAIENSGYKMFVRNTIVSLTPADIKKEGAAYDLPIAIGILATSQDVAPERLGRFMMMGELSLSGALLPVRGVLPIAIMAREKGFDGLIVPIDNVREASVVDKIQVYGAKNLTEVIDLLNNADNAILPTETGIRAEFARQRNTYESDFSDVKGQLQVKRAMEVAAAGGHNILLIGSPGSGKSMLAQRLPTILPPLSLGESLEVTKIYSVAGKLKKGEGGLIVERPFRNPHHTASPVALVGGGQTAQPGEMSLAHNGVLYLDELPEFPRSVLEVLRQPLEDREINISRARYAVTYPASFMFCASMNPCPCGYYGDPTHKCTCTPGMVAHYRNKVSGPLLDRIDIQVNVLPLKLDEMTSKLVGETSAQVRERVVAARKVQEARFANVSNIHCNAQMTSAMLRDTIRLSEESTEMLRVAMRCYGLSARAYDRVLRLARTIADLAGSPEVERVHICEAISYRSLDKEM